MAAKSDDGMRNSYMDFLKGIAILSVIVGHSLSDIRGMDTLFNLIYSFHMPLLFFVSAYIEEQNSAKYVGREGRMLVRRMSGLLLPYLSWTIIYAVVFGHLWGIDYGGQFLFRVGLHNDFVHLWKTEVKGLLSNLFGYGSNGLWFFPVLFGMKVMHVLYWVIHSKIDRNTIVTDVLLFGGLEIVIALLAVLTRQPYIINMLSYAIPYFFAIILVKHKIMQKLINSEWMAAGAMLIYALGFSYFSFYDTNWTTQVVRIGLSLCVIVVCCKFMYYKFNGNRNQWSMKHPCSVICICGENSLAIYVLHGFLIDYKEYFNMIDSAFLAGVVSIVLAFLVALVCIVITKVIEVSSWCKKILLGK